MLNKIGFSKAESRISLKEFYLAIQKEKASVIRSLEFLSNNLLRTSGVKEVAMASAACYIRVSTDDQTEYSPDAQLRAIREFCKRNDFELQENHIYIDEGISGRSAAKRPEFQKMIAAAKSKYKPFEAIIVHKFDRFARSREDSVVYKSLLRKECGIKVLSVTENIEDDKFSVILEAMLEAMAEYYSINLAEEVKKGMTEKALRGEPLTIPPYGYKMENKQLVIHPEQFEIIRNIFDSFLKGEGYFQIAKKLNNAGFRTNRGNRWENRTIEYILRNPVYIGKIRWNPKYRTRRKYDDENVLITQGSHEPIISEELFSKIQDRAQAIKVKYKKYSKTESSSHWLVGLLKCSSCGTGLVKNGRIYMQCGNYVRGRCNLSHLLQIKSAEELVINQIENDAAGIAPLQLAVSNKTLLNDSFIKKQILALEKRLERFKEAYSAGVDTLEEYKSNKEKISMEIELLKAKTETESLSGNPQEIDRVKLKKAAEQLRSTLPLENKKLIASEIISYILFDKPNLTLNIVYNA